MQQATMTIENEKNVKETHRSYLSIVKVFSSLESLKKVFSPSGFKYPCCYCMKIYVRHNLKYFIPSTITHSEDMSFHFCTKNSPVLCNVFCIDFENLFLILHLHNFRSKSK